MQNRYEKLLAECDPNLKPGRKVEGTLKWHSPLDQPFHIAGFGWFAGERKYRRLPTLAEGMVPEAVDRLANHTAGGQVRFRTDSTSLSVRVKLKGKAHLPHMAPTGQCGVDCYVGDFGALKFVSTTKFDFTLDEYESSLFAGWSNETRSIVLNLPLYQGIEEIWIGLDEYASVMSPPAYACNKKVVFYGTSVTQGGCASRPGMLHTNILSRRIPLEFVNLGFSGSGRGEAEVAQVVSRIEDPACFILDYEGNCKSTELFAQTLPEFIRICRSRHPDTPILVPSRIRYARESEHAWLYEARTERKELQQDVVHHLRAQGDHSIYFFDGSELLGEDYRECTVDGSHPTDLGYIHMANGYEPVLRALLL
ncbi:hypothetical protein HII30_05560 [Paenibacillus lemnae]|uniref:Lipase n=2 Tax=Paenibacillus lemnae TaxID=1330551 RepID=A0A848M3A9_PAELE|nr:hypothetical protein [Paenibacillus lemnae]